MSCYYIKVEKGRKVARPITSEQEYRELRNSSQQMANLRLARNGNDAAKRRLVQMNYSGHYPGGTVKGNKLPSKAFGFDLDDPESFKIAAEKLLQDPGKYGLLMLERSARQGGHVVCKREQGKTILENQVRLATMLQCEMDTSAHDINRVYFTTTAAADDLLYLSPELFADSYDEAAVKAEAKLLEEREKYGQEVLPEGAHKVNKHYKPWEVAAPQKEAEIKAENTAAEQLNQAENSASKNTENHQAEQSEQTTETASSEPLNYCGIPYSEIIRKWWQMYNDGNEPVRSNRNTLTFELAVNLRHICGFDRQQLDQVIPCYDGFPETEKLACIDSALAEKRARMPKRLKDVLAVLKSERQKGGMLSDEESKTLDFALDEVCEQDDLYYYNSLPSLPQGVRDSINAVGPVLAMPALIAICPAIGSLATGVKISVHGRYNSLNLISYIAGDFASGKGSIDPLIDAWMGEVKDMDKVYLEKEEDWRTKKRAAQNKKEQPEEVKYPVRCLTLNNTVANLANRLANTGGKHAFSFTPEADTVAQKWRTAMSDFSVMLRQAYDGTSYDREAKSADAVNVHIDRLLWNVTMCGTPDALYRVVNNYTDGFQSRIAVGRTPDNTFAALSENLYVLTDVQRDQIFQIAHLLPLMEGEVVLTKLEKKGREWLEEIRIETMKNDDKTKARQRFRICPTTMRMMTCIMLCKVAEQLIKAHGLAGAEKRLKENPGLWKEMIEKTQTPSMLAVFDALANYQMENALYFFRERIEAAFSSREYAGKILSMDRSRKGKNDTIFELLDLNFTAEQAMQEAVIVKGTGVTSMAVQQMLKNWCRQGLIIKTPDKRFQKIQAAIK